MITETAKVVAVEGDWVTVEAAIKTTCSSCQAQSDCGTGAISRAIAPKSQQLTLRTPFPVKVGDEVKVGIPEVGLVAASAWLYLAPLLIFITSALLFSQLFAGSGEGWVVLASALTMVAGFVAVSRFIKRLDNTRFQPVILASQQANTVRQA